MNPLIPRVYKGKNSKPLLLYLNRYIDINKQGGIMIEKEN